MVEKTRWLDANEQVIWRSFIAATTLLIEQFDRDLQRDASVPIAYYEILFRLSESPDRALRMSELADRCRSSRSRLSHTIAKLEEVGWVRRESCPSDRRGAFAVLSDDGFAALEAAAPVHVESVRSHLFDQLTKAQLEQLHQMSEQILDHLVGIGAIPLDARGVSVSSQ
jgi:DNA-binding MarR family transcriptional regulator